MTTTSPIHHAPEATDARPGTSRALAPVGLIAGVIASAATVTTAWAATAVDIPMQVAASSGDVAEDIPWSGYVTLTLAGAVAGTLLAIGLARRAKRPARTFVVATTALLVLSLVGPFTAHHATTATRVVLSLTHAVAAAIVIPMLAQRLRHQRG